MLATLRDRGNELHLLGERVLRLVCQLGARDAEVYATKLHEFSVRGHEFQVDWLRSAISRGVGVRVITEGRTGYAYTSDLVEAGLVFLAERAVANSRYGPSDAYSRLPLPTKGPLPAVPGLVDPSLPEIPSTAKIDFLHAMTTAAKGCGKGIQVLRVHYGDEYRQTCIVNTHGIDVEFERTSAYGWLETVIVEGDEKQTAHSYTVGRSVAQLDFVGAGREAGEVACSYLGARSVPSGLTTVVFSPLASAIFLHHISSFFSGLAELRGVSPFRGRVGQEVANVSLSIIDDALLPGGMASRPVDDEGVPSQRVKVVARGRLISLLHNTPSAHRAGTQSTGHARRASYRSLPSIAPSNIFIEPSQTDPTELIAGVEDGVLARDLVGWEAIQPHTGEFSAIILGQRIEGGHLTTPIGRTVLAGRVQDLLQRLVAVGRDLRWVPIDAAVGAPTLVFEGVKVSGG